LLQFNQEKEESVETWEIGLVIRQDFDRMLPATFANIQNENKQAVFSALLVYTL